MTIIALLRHGPTEWNALGKIQGFTDIPLSAEGISKMRGLKPPPPFHRVRVYASPLMRARQTAEALGLADPLLDRRLMEQNWGGWEGMSRAEILARDGEDAFLRAGVKLAFRPPGGESTAELHDRVAAFLKDVAARREDAVAVTHFGVLRAAYTLATGWDMATIMPADLDVAKVLVLELTEDGTPKLKTLNLGFNPKTA
jgi:probable phosphoglycerate mutase